MTLWQLLVDLAPGIGCIFITDMVLSENYDTFQKAVSENGSHYIVESL